MFDSIEDPNSYDKTPQFIENALNWYSEYTQLCSSNDSNNPNQIDEQTQRFNIGHSILWLISESELFEQSIPYSNELLAMVHTLNKPTPNNTTYLKITIVGLVSACNVFIVNLEKLGASFQLIRTTIEQSNYSPDVKNRMISIVNIAEEFAFR